ncbi:flagellar biosynthetic protein FliO, partial [Nitratireductor sp. ZSWI3]|uniref:flagellar biosynthetic protein FliO n=1 Tax=Nitratireductor sp. ZSWI3 TaxID=2966359 RepID=UPI002150038C
MRGLLVDIFGEAYAEAAFWVVVLVAVAILLWVILRITRGMTPGTFISGARGRQPRLAVTDATPVDNHRRLVLVRRDDVEHLILIGGPSDVVVESNIRAFEPAEQASAHSPAEKAERKAPAVPAPTAAPAAGPRPARPAEPQPRPAPARPAAPPAAEPQVPPDRAPEAW